MDGNMHRGWPNTQRPGEPRNPGESGPHWIDRGHGAEILYWDADEACWPTDARDITPDLAEHYWSYLRPVTSPREDAAKDRRIAKLAALVGEKLGELQDEHDHKGHCDHCGEPSSEIEWKVREWHEGGHQDHCWMVRARNLLSMDQDHAAAGAAR